MKLSLWTISQRRALVILCIALSSYIGVRFALNRRHVPDPQPIAGELASQLQDKIDPNTADAATLGVLPLIGEKRAADMVAYRDKFLQAHPGEIAFKRLEDLRNIKGIGPSTIAQMSPYLMFPAPATPATTNRSAE